MFSNSEIEPEKTWPTAQFVSNGKARLDSTCLEEPLEKIFLKKRSFFQYVWTENKTILSSLIKFLARMSKFCFPCPQEQFEETFFWNFAKFLIFLAIEQKLCWTKQGRRIAEIFRKTFVTSKNILRRPFWRYNKVCGFKKQNLRQASRSFFRSLLSHSNRCFRLLDLLLVHAIVWQRLHLRALKCSQKKVEEKVWFWKKEKFQWNNKTKFLKNHLSLHETPTKIRLIFFKRVGEKSRKRTKLKLITTGRTAAAGLFFIFHFC